MNATYTFQPNLTAAATVGGLWSTGSGAPTISGSPLTLNGAMINSNSATGIETDPGAGSLTITAPLVLGGPQTWRNNSSTPLTVSGNVANGGNLLTIAGSGNTTLSAVLSGSGGLTMAGGNLILNAFNTYTGLTAISAGTLTAAQADNSGINNIGTFNAAGAGITIGPAGTLVASQINSIFGHWWPGGGNGTNWPTITNAGLMIDTAGANENLGPLTLAGGTMAATGSGDQWGTWNLNNDVTVTANSLISAAAFDLGGNQPAGQRTFTVNPGATLGVSGYFRNGGGTTFGAVINGGGTMVLYGDNTYTGTTTVNAGTLRIVNGGQIYSNLADANQGYGNLPGGITVNSGGALEFDNFAYGACFGELWDTASNILVNGGTLRYAGSGSNSGAHSFTIGANGATLDAASSGHLWTIAAADVYSLASSNSGLLTLTGVGNGEIDQIIPGGGGLTKGGSGTWTLTAANTYTGTTTVNAGTLRIVSGGQIYGNLVQANQGWGNLPGAITINSGAALEFDNYAYGHCFGELWDTSENIFVNGGTLRYVGSGNTSGGQSLTIGASGATLDAASGGHLWTIENGDIHSLVSGNGGMLILTGAGNGEIDQDIPGSGGLTKSGSARGPSAATTPTRAPRRSATARWSWLRRPPWRRGRACPVGSKAASLFAAAPDGAVVASHAVSPVPEPGTLVLLAAGLIVGFGLGGEDKDLVQNNFLVFGKKRRVGPASLRAPAHQIL